MPDTGAPWNIPYVDPTDLVRDYPQASEDLADAIALGLSAAGNPGIGSNVVQTVKTDTFSSTSSTYEIVTGLTLNITPTTNTSRILVVAMVPLASDSSSADGQAQVSVFREGTNLLLPDSPGNRTATNHNLNFRGLDRGSQAMLSHTFVFLDSPAVNTEITYDVRIKQAGAGRIDVNRSDSDADNAANLRGVATLIAIEVAP